MISFDLHFRQSRLKSAVARDAGRHRQQELGRDVMLQKGALGSALASVDRCAEASTDALLLIGRILIALLFLLTAWFGSPNAGYLKFLGYPSPDVLSVIAIVVEYLIIISLVFGVATRIGTLLGIAFVVVATITAHRYWTYADAQAQQVNWIYLTKNLAILGGLVVLFVSGAGRYALDATWRSRN
jgi:putative oxidoreductase